MGMTVIVSVEFAVDSIIDPGGWCCIARLEYITGLRRFAPTGSLLPTHFEPGAAVAIVMTGDTHTQANHGTAKHSAIHKARPLPFSLHNNSQPIGNNYNSCLSALEFV